VQNENNAVPRVLRPRRLVTAVGKGIVVLVAAMRYEILSHVTVQNLARVCKVMFFVQ
jgi:hypothetical protein